MIKLCHLTSVHSRFDIRIFHKECASLARKGFMVDLVVADGKGDEETRGVRIVDAGASKGRLDRMRHAPARVLAKALELDADVYHLHAPELIPVGLKLKKLAKRLFFGTHEDFSQQLRSEPYPSASARWFLSLSFVLQKCWDCRRFDAMLNVLLGKIVLCSYARRGSHREFVAHRQQSGLASLCHSQCGSSK